VEVLDRIIEEAEKQQQQQQQQGGGQGSGQGSGQQQGSGGQASGNQAPSGGANQSSLPPGAARVGALTQEHKGRPGEEWGELKNWDREKVQNALKTHFPQRYREMVEQYYLSLQKEDE